mgnify:FL=1
MTGGHNASYLRKCTDVKFRGTRLGSINDIGHNITDEDALWMLESAEKHNVSVAEWLSGVVKDAYFEENDQ